MNNNSNQREREQGLTLTARLKVWSTSDYWSVDLIEKYLKERRGDLVAGMVRYTYSLARNGLLVAGNHPTVVRRIP